MHVLVEFWKAQPGWFELSDAEREAYLGMVMPGIQHLMDEGVVLMAIEASGSSKRRHPDYDYWAVWQVPGPDHVSLIRNTMQELGWNSHFEEVRLDVEGRSMVDLLGPSMA